MRPLKTWGGGTHYIESYSVVGGTAFLCALLHWVYRMTAVIDSCTVSDVHHMGDEARCCFEKNGEEGVKIRDQPLNSLNHTKFPQFIIRLIIKFMTVRCHILGLKCTKFDSSWCSVPDPAG